MHSLEVARTGHRKTLHSALSPRLIVEKIEGGWRHGGVVGARQRRRTVGAKSQQPEGTPRALQTQSLVPGLLDPAARGWDALLAILPLRAVLGGVRRARRWPSLAALAGPSRPHGPYGRPEAPWASNNRASGAGHAVAAPRCPRGRNARAGRSSQSGFGPRRRADGTRGRPAMLGRGFAPRAARGARWRRAGVLLADA